jgi:hypothetical protein
MDKNKYKKKRISKSAQLASLIKQQEFDMEHDNDIKQHRDNETNREIRASWPVSSCPMPY